MNNFTLGTLGEIQASLNYIMKLCFDAECLWDCIYKHMDLGH